jgi:hypothetical protein
MATYAELLTLWNDSALFNKIRVAVIVAAEKIRVESEATTKHAERLAWAKGAIQNPDVAAQVMLNAVLAQNAGVALAAITGATDAQVQTAVDNAVAFFI